MSKGKIAGSIVALLAVVAVIATFQTSNVSQTRNLAETISDVFTQWKIVYGKSYASADEEAHRFQTFQDNFYFIQNFNANPEHTSTVGLNEYADLNTQEFKALKSCTGMTQPTPVVQTTTVDVEAVNALPASVDWRTKNAVTPIKNQGDCGSCWSFSTTGSLEGLYAITKGSLLSFSEQQLVDCSGQYGNEGCDGGWPFWALEYTQAEGIELESVYPYVGVDQTCAYAAGSVVFTNTGGYTNVTKNNEVALATAVVQQPISICVEADQPVFQLYTGGIINSASCGTQLDHAILIVGYNVQGNQPYWIVKNSWGTSWGLAGYLYIAKSSSTNTNGICGIAMNPTYPTV